MHIKLPSNRIGGLFVVIVLIVVLVISGDVVLEKFGTMGGSQIVDGNLYLERKITEESTIDSDSDGLLDWQELLYNSNSNLADTDGDGTNDGDEIKEGRDPTVAGPDDKMMNLGDFGVPNFSVDYQPNSVTGNMSVELLANYLNLKKSDVYDQSTTEMLTTDLANKAQSSVTLPNPFSIDKIKTVATSQETLKKYGTEFANIYISSVTQMRNVPRNDDYAYVSEIASRYKKLAQALSMIDVPSNTANVHVEIINKIYNDGALIEELNNYNSDPVKGLFAVKQIKENGTGQVELYKTLANYFADNGIIFLDNDVTIFWNSIK